MKELCDPVVDLANQLFDSLALSTVGNDFADINLPNMFDRNQGIDGGFLNEPSRNLDQYLNSSNTENRLVD